MSSIALIAAVSLSLAALQASPLPPPPPSQEAATDLPPVMVQGRVLEGRALETLARDFIGEVSAPPRGVSVARWHRSVCVGVVNLPAEAAQFVVDRVSAVAAEVGLEPGEPGCSPQVVIVATLEGTAVAGALVERRRRTFSPGGDGFSRSRDALARFATEDRPVRWWHLSTPTDPDTGDAASYRPGSGIFADPRENIPQVSVIGTLLAAQIRQDLDRAIIIVDFSKLGDVDFDQLADYLALVALAQIDPRAETAAYPTILNVFDDPAGTPGLTGWDRAYLRGLYQSDDTAPSAIAREGAIRREMLRARQDATTAPQAD